MARGFARVFRWGTATSAHQVEGCNRNNDWWAFEQLPGRIRQGDRSGRACDWWRNAEADFDRMVALHLNAHRLSVEWSRLEPQAGRVDESAVRRYRQMLRGLRERGVEPMVTLHHFTLPLWVARAGGWENPEAVDWFLDEYRRKYFERMKGLVCGVFFNEDCLPYLAEWKNHRRYEYWRNPTFSPRVLALWREYCRKHEVTHEGKTVTQFPVHYPAMAAKGGGITAWYPGWNVAKTIQ
ncbi:MAG: family 1 glycosylhydrolase, partial [bacterium]